MDLESYIDFPFFKKISLDTYLDSEIFKNMNPFFDKKTKVLEQYLTHYNAIANYICFFFNIKNDKFYNKNFNCDDDTDENHYGKEIKIENVDKYTIYLNVNFNHDYTQKNCIYVHIIHYNVIIVFVGENNKVSLFNNYNKDGHENIIDGSFKENIGYLMNTYYFKYISFDISKRKKNLLCNDNICNLKHKNNNKEFETKIYNDDGDERIVNFFNLKNFYRNFKKIINNDDTRSYRADDSVDIYNDDNIIINMYKTIESFFNHIYTDGINEVKKNIINSIKNYKIKKNDKLLNRKIFNCFNKLDIPNINNLCNNYEPKFDTKIDEYINNKCINLKDNENTKKFMNACKNILTGTNILDNINNFGNLLKELFDDKKDELNLKKKIHFIIPILLNKLNKLSDDKFKNEDNKRLKDTFYNLIKILSDHNDNKNDITNDDDNKINDAYLSFRVNLLYLYLRFSKKDALLNKNNNIDNQKLIIYVITNLNVDLIDINLVDLYKLMLSRNDLVEKNIKDDTKITYNNYKDDIFGHLKFACEGKAFEKTVTLDERENFDTINKKIKLNEENIFDLTFNKKYPVMYKLFMDNGGYIRYVKYTYKVSIFSNFYDEDFNKIQNNALNNYELKDEYNKIDELINIINDNGNQLFKSNIKLINKTDIRDYNFDNKNDTLISIKKDDIKIYYDYETNKTHDIYKSIINKLDIKNFITNMNKYINVPSNDKSVFYGDKYILNILHLLYVYRYDDLNDNDIKKALNSNETYNNLDNNYIKLLLDGDIKELINLHKTHKKDDILYDDIEHINYDSNTRRLVNLLHANKRDYTIKDIENILLLNFNVTYIKDDKYTYKYYIDNLNIFSNASNNNYYLKNNKYIKIDIINDLISKKIINNITYTYAKNDEKINNDMYKFALEILRDNNVNYNIWINNNTHYSELYDYDNTNNNHTLICKNNDSYININDKKYDIINKYNKLLGLWSIGLTNGFLVSNGNNYYLLLFMNSFIFNKMKNKKLNYFINKSFDFNGQYKDDKIIIYKFNDTMLDIDINDGNDLLILFLSLWYADNDICLKMIYFLIKPYFKLYKNKDNVLYSLYKKIIVEKLYDIPIRYFSENKKFDQQVNNKFDFINLNESDIGNYYADYTSEEKKIKDLLVNNIIDNKISEKLGAFVDNYKNKCKDNNSYIFINKLQNIDDNDNDDIFNDIIKSNEFNLYNTYIKYYIYFYSIIIKKKIDNIYNEIDDIVNTKKIKDCLKLKKAIEYLDSDIIYNFKNKRNVEDIIFEIHSNIILRNDQKITLNDKIFPNLIKNKNENAYQILMGRGKTSTLTPLIILNFLYDPLNNEDKSVSIVLPNHLTISSYNIMLKFVNLIDLKYTYNNRNIYNLKKYLCIISDSNLKEMTLKKNDKNLNEYALKHINDDITRYEKDYVDLQDINDKNIIQNKINKLKKYRENLISDKTDYQKLVIFDEIDSLINPLKSNLNIMNGDKKPHQNAKDIIKRCQIFANNLHNKKDYKYDENNFIDKKIKKITGIIKSMTYNQNYGFGKIKDKMEKHSWYIAIPYDANNSPVEGSEFTDYEITICLTYLSYYNNKKLRYIDIFNIFETIYKNISYELNFLEIIYNEIYKILLEYCNNDSKSLEKLHNDIITSLKMDKFTYTKTLLNIIEFLDKNIQHNYYFINFYLDEIIFSKYLNISDNQYNISMIDMFNKNIQKIVSFSGTVDFTPPLKIINNIVQIDKDNDKFKNQIKNIVEDEFSSNSVYCSLYNCNINGKIPEIQNYDKNVSKEKIEDNLLKYLIDNIKMYSSLIDVAGLILKRKPLEIISHIKISLKGKNKDTKILYINDDGVKMIYNCNDDTTNKYNNEIFENVFMYYDNKNCVGTDFKQPFYMHGLLTLSDINTYSQCAQGIFRLRNINVGHSIDFYYPNLDGHKTKSNYDKIDKIFNNLTNFEKKNNEHSLNKMNMQCLKYINRCYYKNDEDIYKENIFFDCKDENIDIDKFYNDFVDGLKKNINVNMYDDKTKKIQYFDNNNIDSLDTNINVNVNINISVAEKPKKIFNIYYNIDAINYQYTTTKYYDSIDNSCEFKGIEYDNKKLTLDRYKDSQIYDEIINTDKYDYVNMYGIKKDKIIYDDIIKYLYDKNREKINNPYILIDNTFDNKLIINFETYLSIILKKSIKKGHIIYNSYQMQAFPKISDPLIKIDDKIRSLIFDTSIDKFKLLYEQYKSYDSYIKYHSIINNNLCNKYNYFGDVIDDKTMDNFKNLYETIKIMIPTNLLFNVNKDNLDDLILYENTNTIEKYTNNLKTTIKKNSCDENCVKFFLNYYGISDKIDENRKNKIINFLYNKIIELFVDVKRSDDLTIIKNFITDIINKMIKEAVEKISEIILNIQNLVNDVNKIYDMPKFDNNNNEFIRVRKSYNDYVNGLHIDVKDKMNKDLNNYNDKMIDFENQFQSRKKFIECYIKIKENDNNIGLILEQNKKNITIYDAAIKKIDDDIINKKSFDDLTKYNDELTSINLELNKIKNNTIAQKRLFNNIMSLYDTNKCKDDEEFKKDKEFDALIKKINNYNKIIIFDDQDVDNLLGKLKLTQQKINNKILKYNDVLNLIKINYDKLMHEIKLLDDSINDIKSEGNKKLIKTLELDKILIDDFDGDIVDKKKELDNNYEKYLSNIKKCNELSNKYDKLKIALNKKVSEIDYVLKELNEAGKQIRELINTGSSEKRDGILKNANKLLDTNIDANIDIEDFIIFNGDIKKINDKINECDVIKKKIKDLLNEEYDQNLLLKELNNKLNDLLEINEHLNPIEIFKDIIKIDDDDGFLGNYETYRKTYDDVNKLNANVLNNASDKINEDLYKKIISNKNFLVDFNDYKLIYMYNKFNEIIKDEKILLKNTLVNKKMKEINEVIIKIKIAFGKLNTFFKSREINFDNIKKLFEKKKEYIGFIENYDNVNQNNKECIIFCSDLIKNLELINKENNDIIQFIYNANNDDDKFIEKYVKDKNIDINKIVIDDKDLKIMRIINSYDNEIKSYENQINNCMNEITLYYNNEFKNIKKNLFNFKKIHSIEYKKILLSFDGDNELKKMLDEKNSILLSTFNIIDESIKTIKKLLGLIKNQMFDIKSFIKNNKKQMSIMSKLGADLDAKFDLIKNKFKLGESNIFKSYLLHIKNKIDNKNKNKNQIKLIKINNNIDYIDIAKINELNRLKQADKLMKSSAAFMLL